MVWRWSAGGNRREGDNVTGGHVYCWVSSWTRRKAYVFGVPAELRTRRVPDNRESLTLLEGAFPMIEVSIPSMEREVDESGKSKKLFRVEVLFNERKHYVLRRNSEFQTLHRKLRKIIHTPDFPSKRNPHLRTKPLEQRKQELEDYIQSIICQYEDVPQVLLDFLHIKHFNTGRRMSSVESLDMDSHTCSCQLPHQRVLGFLQDPYLSDCTSGLPDVVVDGVLQGFYPRDNRVTFTAPVLTEPDPTISIEA